MFPEPPDLPKRHLVSYVPVAGDVIIHHRDLSAPFLESLVANLPKGSFTVVRDKKDRAEHKSMLEMPWSNNSDLRNIQLRKIGAQKDFTPADYYSIRGTACQHLFDFLIDGEIHSEEQMIEVTGQKQALRRARSLRSVFAYVGLDLIRVNPSENDGVNFGYKVGTMLGAFEKITQRIMTNDTIL